MSSESKSMPSIPDWQPLDGARPAPAGGAPGRVVALVASERAVSEGWAASAALDVARAWSANGQKVVLVDAVLNRPSLHAAASVPNREGLTDAALYGASVQRVSHPVDGGTFFLITAGTPVADASSVVRSSRWFRFTAGMAEAGATLALFLNDGESGTAAFLGSASDIVLLANPGDEPPMAIRDLEPLVRSVTGPAAPASAAAAGHGTPVAAGGGGGYPRMLLFIFLAVVVAGLLGFLLTSGPG